MTTIIGALIGSFSFAILFHAPRRSYFTCALCGCLSWAMFLLFEKAGCSEFQASVLAVIGLTVLSRVLAVALKLPVTVFIVTGIVPLVPGAGIYYTAYSLITRDMALFSERSMQTVSLAGAIAIGILIAMALPNALPRFLGHLISRLLPEPKDDI